MSAHRRRVAAVVDALEIHSPTSYSWFWQRADGLPEETTCAMDAPTARGYLTHALRSRLYDDFYCKGEATPTSERKSRGRNPPAWWSPFMQSLSVANAGRGSSEPGWTFREHDEEKLVVDRHGLAVWVGPADLVWEDGADDLTPGKSVRVRLPNELRRLSPGFYVALGDNGIASDDDDALVRLYWNLTSRGASRFVAIATAALNRADVAFQLKVADDPDNFDRCDAGVVYLAKRNWPAAARLIGPLYRELAAALEPATPALTKRLAPGLGLAEDPGGGESFGAHRCLLLADGLLMGHEQGRRSTAEVVDAVAERFAGAGIDLDAPYLSPGSADDYARLPG